MPAVLTPKRKQLLRVADNLARRLGAAGAVNHHVIHGLGAMEQNLAARRMNLHG